MGQGETTRLSVPPIGRTVLWFATFVAIALVADDDALFATDEPVVGPAVAVALLWLASSTVSMLKLDVALIALASIGVSLAWGKGVWFPVVELVMAAPALLVVLGLRRWCPQMWGGGGRCAMRTMSEFGRFLALVVASTLLCTAVRTALGVLLVDGESWEPFLLRAGRTVAALVALGVFGLLLGGRLAERRDLGEPLFTVRPLEVVELLLVATYTALVLWQGFVLHPHVPSTFLLALGVVWVSVRFSPFVSAAAALVVGGAAAALTLQEHGPIAVVAELDGRGLMALVFMMVMMVTGMAVSLSRGQVVEAFTRLRRSEGALARRASELDLMLETLSDGVAIVEEGGRVVHSNTALRRLLTGPDGQGYDERRIMPAADYHLHHPDGRPLAEDDLPFLRALRGETVRAEEFHLRRPSVPGGRVLEISAIALPVEPGELPRAMATVRDVTTETAHRDALADFAGTVAHDLNNPLSVVSGWAESLDEEFRSNEQVPATTGAPMVAHIKAATDRMREFISDLLAHTVAKDQALQLERVPLRNVVKDLEDTWLGPGSTHFDIDTGDLPDVWADRALVTQLLDNLVGNAVKYVAPGTLPHVQVTAEESGGWATVRVCDNGIGIPEEQRQRIFETFQRAGRQDYHGHGLGLAICKRIVERHGGTITVTENPQRGGSCFVFTLPTTAEAFASRERGGAPVDD